MNVNLTASSEPTQINIKVNNIFLYPPSLKEMSLKNQSTQAER